MYEGNADMIALLLGEDRLDTSIRDKSGLTAWDLLRETVEADMPIRPQGHLELFTWYAHMFCLLESWSLT